MCQLERVYTFQLVSWTMSICSCILYYINWNVSTRFNWPVEPCQQAAVYYIINWTVSTRFNWSVEPCQYPAVYYIINWNVSTRFNGPFEPCQQADVSTVYLIVSIETCCITNHMDRYGYDHVVCILWPCAFHFIGWTRVIFLYQHYNCVILFYLFLSYFDNDMERDCVVLAYLLFEHKNCLMFRLQIARIGISVQAYIKTFYNYTVRHRYNAVFGRKSWNDEIQYSYAFLKANGRTFWHENRVI